MPLTGDPMEPTVAAPSLKVTVTTNVPRLPGCTSKPKTFAGLLRVTVSEGLDVLSTRMPGVELSTAAGYSSWARTCLVLWTRRRCPRRSTFPCRPRAW